MDSQVLAALLGALVGGLASGVAALGGSLVVEKMKRRKDVRIQIYNELLLPLRAVMSTYTEAVENQREVREPQGLVRFDAFDRPPLPPDFFTLLDQLEHISWMGDAESRKAVSRLKSKVSEYQTKRQGQLPGNSDRVIELVDEINQDIDDLYNRLRKKVD